MPARPRPDTAIRAFFADPPASWAKAAARFRAWLDARPEGLTDGSSWVRAIVEASPAGENRSLWLKDVHQRAQHDPRYLPSADTDVLLHALVADAAACENASTGTRHSLAALGGVLDHAQDREQASRLLASALADRAPIAALEVILPHAWGSAPSHHLGRSCLQEAAAQRLIGPAGVAVTRWFMAGADFDATTSEGQSLLHLILAAAHSPEVLALSVVGSLVAVAPCVSDAAWTAPDSKGVRACDLWAAWAASPRVRAAFEAVPQGPLWLARAELEAATPLVAPSRRHTPRL